MPNHASFFLKQEDLRPEKSLKSKSYKFAEENSNRILNNSEQPPQTSFLVPLKKAPIK